MLAPKTVKAIREHAISVYPEECCGVIITKGKKDEYVPFTNVLDTPEKRREGFRMGKADLTKALSIGEIVAYVHSHPDASDKPSEADLVSMEALDLPWVIVSTYRDLDGDGKPTAGNPALYQPSGYVAPLEGRMFYHGVLDCYTLVRDYYQRELGITLMDFERDDQWWEKPGESLYMKNLEVAGFVQIGQDFSKVQVGDMLLLELMSSAGPNHAAIYIGDGMILHHCYGRLSCREVFGGYWQECTRMITRHKDMMK